MEKWHKLLERQIANLGDLMNRLAPEDARAFDIFLDKVQDAYRSFEDDRELLENSMELSSRELFEINREMRLQNKEIQSIYNITTLLQDSSDPSDVFAEILSKVSHTTGFPFAAVGVLCPESKILNIAEWRGFSRPPDKDDADQRAVCDLITGLVINTGSDNFQCLDVEALGAQGEALLSLGVKSAVCVPLKSQSNTFGALLIGHGENVCPPDRIGLWLKSVAGQLTAALEKSLLESIAEKQRADLVAASKMSTLGEMAGGVAHEINNPLAIIQTVAAQIEEMLNDDPLDRVFLKEQFGLILQTCQRIAKIVQGLRTFSRDGSHDPFDILNVYQLVDDALGFCSERFRINGTKISIESMNDAITVNGRSTQLSQVLVNLLNNSFDAIQSLPEKWVKVSAVETGDAVEVRVMDSGSGIPKSMQEKIFQPFYTTKEIGKGTGLGLSISVGIVKAHGGRLYIDSSCPHTCFVIRLPKPNPALTA